MKALVAFALACFALYVFGPQIGQISRSLQSPPTSSIPTVTNGTPAAAPATLAPVRSEPCSVERQITWMPGVNRYVDHPSNVSASVASGLSANVGPGGNVKPRRATQSSGEAEKRKEWGFQPHSALDR